MLWAVSLVVVLMAALAGWWLAGRAVESTDEAATRRASAAPQEEAPVDFLTVDTHIDLPYRLYGKGANADDVSRRTSKGDFDAVRAKKGGLDVAWMSIYIPAEYQRGDGAKAYADSLIDLVEGIAASHPRLFAVARSADHAEAIATSGRIALPMGMENGAGIESDLANLEHFHDRGIRYITLTHSEDNRISDSSYSPPEGRKWNGLSPFGRQVVAEMNRLGILVDVSHVSDEAFDQAVALAQAPPIASHSSCRRFTPGFERNLDDERIRTLAEKGGVIQINFGSAFLTEAANAWSVAAFLAEDEFVRRTNAKEATAELDEFRERYRADNPFPRASIDDVVAHIEHVIEIAGVEHVGIGSDFDGVGDSLPTGLEDVSKYPALAEALLERGHSEEDVAKVMGGNLMRVWRRAEEVARAISAGPAPGGAAAPVVLD